MAAPRHMHSLLQGVSCANCSAPNPRFRCRRCRDREYCSKECQRAGWKTHKTECRDAFELHGGIDGDTRELLIDGQYNKWTEAVTSILSKHALLALDLANNRDTAYLTSINVFVVCVFRSFGNDTRTDAQSFKIERYRLYRDKDMYDAMRVFPEMASDIETRRKSRIDNPNAVRIIAGDNRCNGILYVPLDGADAEACRRQSPTVSAMRSRTWGSSLKACLDAGNVDFSI